MDKTGSGWGGVWFWIIFFNLWWIMEMYSEMNEPSYYDIMMEDEMRESSYNHKISYGVSTPDVELTTKDVRDLCGYNIFDCAAAQTQSRAQWLFEFCKKYGYGDVHHFDADGDGIACESLR